MNKRTLIATPVIGVLILLLIVAFKSPETPVEPEPIEAKEYMMVTTVESIIPAGLGRSRMFTTNSDGSLIEEDMENIYALIGIKMKNINENDAQIIAKINELEAEGWSLTEVTVGVQSPGGEGAEDGIYMTRYLFSK